MSWSRFDDLYDDHRKVKKAWRIDIGTIGLHAMAITYASRHETDGFIDSEWVAEKLPALKVRERVVGALVGCGLFDEVDGGYAVHDFLDYNPSSAKQAERRRKDSERKARKVAEDSERNPDGIHAESERIPFASHVRASDAPARPPSPSHPIPALPDPAPTQPHANAGEGEQATEPLTGHAKVVADVIAILQAEPRIFISQVGIENSIAAWPGRDPINAAHVVVSWVSDPAFNTTNGARLLGTALSKQTPAAADTAAPTDFSKYDIAAERKRREREAA